MASAIKNYKVQWQKFRKNAFLWILGIPINVLPVLFKQIKAVTISSIPSIANLALMTLADFDFSFISISALFILCIEGYFLDVDTPQWYREFRICPFLCLCGLLVAYCVFFFKPELFSGMQHRTKITYNGVVLGLTIVFGLLCNVAIAMEKGEST